MIRHDKIALLWKRATATTTEKDPKAKDPKAKDPKAKDPKAKDTEEAPKSYADIYPGFTPIKTDMSETQLTDSWEAFKAKNPIGSDPGRKGVDPALVGIFTPGFLGHTDEDGRPIIDVPQSTEELAAVFEGDFGRSSEGFGGRPAKKPADKPAPKGGKVLQKGDKGEAVKALQVKLLEKGYQTRVGYSSSPQSANGIFDKGTKNAVLYFQVLNEIHPPNGIADSRVLDKINSGKFIGPDDTKEPYPDSEKLEYTERDVEAIARGLVVETSFRHNYREMASIIWVMINRSKKWNMPLYKVIDPDTGGGKNWYGRLSKSNRRRWSNASKRKDFGYIKRFVKQVLDGASFQNEIGNKAHFLHPGSMPKCTEEPGSPCRKTRICVDTGKYGKRCLPKWSIEGNTNMAGKVNVQNIGGGRFS
jgi:hypothetical protein